jgi:hypothetical protein
MKWRLYVYFSYEKNYKANSPCFLKRNANLTTFPYVRQFYGEIGLILF